MATRLLSFFRCAATLALSLAPGFATPPFTLSTRMLLEGKPPGGHWTIPRVAAFGPDGHEMLMSVGSGTGCDTQFLFSDDILGDYDERPPRHAKAYRNFAAEHRRLQQERIAAFREYIADVHEARFPERSRLVKMAAPLLDEVAQALGSAPTMK